MVLSVYIVPARRGHYRSQFASSAGVASASSAALHAAKASRREERYRRRRRAYQPVSRKADAGLKRQISKSKEFRNSPTFHVSALSKGCFLVHRPATIQRFDPAHDADLERSPI